jgi:hypothetical protein
MFTTEGPILSKAATSGVRRLSVGGRSSSRGVWATPVKAEKARRLAAVRRFLDMRFRTFQNISELVERNYQQF